MTLCAISPTSSFCPASLDPHSVDQEAFPLPAPSVAPFSLEELLALTSEQRQQGCTVGTQDLQNHQKELRAAREALERALRDAAEASRRGGVWGKLCGSLSKVGKVAAVVAAAAAAVMTAGAGTPVLALAVTALVLSAGASIQGETHFLQQLGMSDNQARWTEFGMLVGSALCGYGAFALAGGATTGAQSTELVWKGAQTTHAAAQGSGGAAAIAQAHQESRALEHEGRAVHLQGSVTLTRQTITMTFDLLEAESAARTRLWAAGAELIASRDETLREAGAPLASRS